MTKRSLLNRAKISEFQKGIHENVTITNIDIKDRKGQNGPINKMIYIKFAQLNTEGKRVAESEMAWWKPDPSSEYFVTNLQEMCLQLYNILEIYIGEDRAFDSFSTVFEGFEFESHQDIHNKKWKQSDVNTLNSNLKTAFTEALANVEDVPNIKFRMKVTTNYKGEGIEIPKYGKFVELLETTPSNLKFSASEIKTHSKSGITEKKTTNASSVNTGATI